MIRPFTLLCLLLACGSGLYLYQEKHRGLLLDREIEATVRATDAAKERMGVLQAEWMLLNDPERLRALADRFLRLQKTAPGQFTTFADLDQHLPAVVAPPPPGSTDTPADAAPRPVPEPPAAPIAEAAPPPAQSAPPAAPPRQVASARPAPDHPISPQPDHAPRAVAAAARPAAGSALGMARAAPQAPFSPTAFSPTPAAAPVAVAIPAAPIVRPALATTYAPVPAPLPPAPIASAPVASAPIASALGMARGMTPGAR